MLWALALQAAQFLPAPAPEATGPDLAYLAQVEQAAEAESWQEEELKQLAPQHAGQFAALTQLVYRADSATLRFSARLAAGSRHDGLNRALLHRGLRSTENNTALACVLAPAVIPAGCHAALLYFMHNPEQTLTRRAAAAARLLDADVESAAEWALALLAGGTRLDQAAPDWADWQRSSRWELTKRIVLLSLDGWLVRHGQEPSNFEPNAAWDDQEAVLRKLGPRVSVLIQRQRSEPETVSWVAWSMHQESRRRLQSAADTGSLAAQRALASMPDRQRR